MAKDATRGIVLMAFGRREYVYMAAHMAMSIKYHNEDIPIQLIHDEGINYLPGKWHQFFDVKTAISDKDLIRNGKIDPGWAKINVYKYIVFHQSIYLDVDGFCFKDIAPAFDLCTSFYHCEVIGTGKKNDKIEYQIWSDNDTIYDHFELDDNQEYRAVQSSFQYYKKSEKAKKLHGLMAANFNTFSPKKLKHHWGHSLPDELIIGGCCAKIKHDPSIKSRVTYFGNKQNRKKLQEVQEKYYVSSLYGNGGASPLVSQTYIAWYDRSIIQYGRKFKLQPLQKAFQLLRKKYVTP